MLPLLARPVSLPYLARSLLRRRKPVTADEADVAGAEVAQQPARALIRRQPVICRPEISLREAAERMAEDGASSVLVRGDDGMLGIVTDSDLRSRVVAGGISVDAPVSEVMTAPVVTVGAEQTGADVMLAMLDNDVRHVPVVSPRSEVLGVIVGIDLVAAEAQTPFVLRRAIADAKTKEELRDAGRSPAFDGDRAPPRRLRHRPHQPGDLSGGRRTDPADDRARDRVGRTATGRVRLAFAGQPRQARADALLGR